MVNRSKKPHKMWVYSPPKPPKAKISDDLKKEVAEKAEEVVELLKKQHIKKMPKEYQWNYIIDIYTKWYRSYFYFCSKYACPGPNAISPFFEARFARMEYIGNMRFNLSYMRHTGEWVELEQGLTIGKCFEAIKSDGFYNP